MNDDSCGSCHFVNIAHNFCMLYAACDTYITGCKKTKFALLSAVYRACNTGPMS